MYRDYAIGHALATLRERQGKRQGDVAEALGCEQSLISKIECGQRSIKLREMPLLASALGLTPQELQEALLRELTVHLKASAGNAFWHLQGRKVLHATACKHTVFTRSGRPTL